MRGRLSKRLPEVLDISFRSRELEEVHEESSSLADLLSAHPGDPAEVEEGLSDGELTVERHFLPTDSFTACEYIILTGQLDYVNLTMFTV